MKTTVQAGLKEFGNKKEFFNFHISTLHPRELRLSASDTFFIPRKKSEFMHHTFVMFLIFYSGLSGWRKLIYVKFWNIQLNAVQLFHLRRHTHPLPGSAPLYSEFTYATLVLFPSPSKFTSQTPAALLPRPLQFESPGIISYQIHIYLYL